jgi:hypothetical protein
MFFNNNINEKNIFNRTCLTIFEKLGSFLYGISTRILRVCHPEWKARIWSNRELRKFGDLFCGDIINVSGWDDGDKEGNFYCDYFPNKSSYVISNISGARGLTGAENEIYLDLSKELPKELFKQYDVVFNHTVLEHIFDIFKAVENLCNLSRDIIILIVPFIQEVHWEPGSYFDYWRPTNFALEQLFSKNGFEILYFSHNDNPAFDVYFFCIASCQPQKWEKIFPPSKKITVINAPGNAKYQYGRPDWLIKKIKSLLS